LQATTATENSEPRKQAEELGKIYDIDAKAAVMVNKIGKIEVATSSWQLLFYYDMQAYFDVIKQSEDFLKKSRLVCEKMRDFKDYCDFFGTTIRAKIDNIKEKDRYYGTVATERKGLYCSLISEMQIEYRKICKRS